MNAKNFVCALALLFIFCISNAQTTQVLKKNTMQNRKPSDAAYFEGAWTTDDNKGFSIMHNGYFNTVAKDSAGKWDEVHAGTYTVNNDNTITFKILYSSYPDHIGALNTAEYTISGNTIKVRHFKKLIDAQGNDITARMPKDAWETITKLK